MLTHPTNRLRITAIKDFILQPYSFNLRIYGGVPDSTFSWSVWLHVEDDGWPRKNSIKKTNGTHEEMPLAA